MQAEEYTWFMNHQKEVLKYKGKHIAIVGNEIVASAKSAKVAYDVAKKKYPGRSPLLHYVPEGDLYVL
ncbi:MAG: DUF5678 domain-containing protein [Nitrososphaera sp.]